MSAKKNNRIILMGVAALLVGLTSACTAEDYNNPKEPGPKTETAPLIDLNFCDVTSNQSGTCVQVGCDFPPPFNDSDFSFRVCNGADGQGCSLGDKVNGCAPLTCGNKTVPVCDGQNGQPCTTSGNGQGSYTLTCPGSDPVTWRDGQPGPAGPPGPKGDTGPQGSSGHNSVTRHTPLQPSLEEGGCPYGGFIFESGVDDGGGDDNETLSDNNVLDDAEVDFMSVVCNGAPGQNGTSYSCSIGELVGLCRTYTCGPVGGAANVTGELCNGAPGTPGAPGQNGTSYSCWFTEKDDRCTTFSCGPVNGSREQVVSTDICDGAPGQDGDSCWVTNDGDCATISCGADVNDPDSNSTICSGDSCYFEDEGGTKEYAAVVFEESAACRTIWCGSEFVEVCDGEPGQDCSVGPKDGLGCAKLCCGDVNDDDNCVQICDGAPGGCSDNAQCSDDNACNGVETCDDGICKPGDFPEPCLPDTACVSYVCDPADGECLATYHNGASCSDGSACNGAETCQEGVCVDGPDMVCDDDNKCTNDSCSGSSCVYTPKVCPDDGNSCTDDVCDPADGMCGVADNTNTCSDDKACTVDECVGGVCVSDDEACTEGCVADADCGAGSYCGRGACYTRVDLRGQTYPGQGGANGGPNPDLTPDSWDDDGDGYCETAPCMGSRNPALAVGSLLGGDCDDNPGSGGITLGSGGNSFQTDGSYYNNPGVSDWVGDNFDNNCNGVVETN